MRNDSLPNEPESAAVAEKRDRFYEQPIPNSPYDYPGRHWKLYERNRPTDRVFERRRPSAYFSTVPRSSKHDDRQLAVVKDEAARTWNPANEQYELTAFISGGRRAMDRWRALPAPAWQVTPETARLLRHWRGHAFGDIRPFFCQGAKAKTAIWLFGRASGRIWDWDFGTEDTATPDPGMLPRDKGVRPHRLVAGDASTHVHRTAIRPSCAAHR